MPPPLVGEALAKDSFFAIIAYGSKTKICRKIHTSSGTVCHLPLKGKALRQQGR